MKFTNILATSFVATGVANGMRFWLKGDERTSVQKILNAAGYNINEAKYPNSIMKAVSWMLGDSPQEVPDQEGGQVIDEVLDYDEAQFIDKAPEQSEAQRIAYMGKRYEAQFMHERLPASIELHRRLQGLPGLGVYRANVHGLLPKDVCYLGGMRNIQDTFSVCTGDAFLLNAVLCGLESDRSDYILNEMLDCGQPCMKTSRCFPQPETCAALKSGSIFKECDLLWLNVHTCNCGAVSPAIHGGSECGLELLDAFQCNIDCYSGGLRGLPCTKH